MAGSEEFISAVLIANEAIASALEQPFRDAGLNFGTFELLAAVRSARGLCSQAELASRLGIRPASLCESVQIATKKGLVEQIPSGSDRRVKNVALTHIGEQALKKAVQALSSLGNQIAKDVSIRDLNDTIRTLETVGQAISRNA
jgi:MarR family transcriptional regulator for hemolysin